VKEPGAERLPPPRGLEGERSTILRLLAAGLSLEAITERFSDRSDRRVTTDEVRTVLRQAATLMEEGASLLPPAQAAFVDHFPAVLAFATLTRSTPQGGSADASASLRGFSSSRPSVEDLGLLRSLSHRAIRAYLDEDDELSDLPGAGQPAQDSVALQYAEAVLRQAEVLARLNDLGEEAPLQTALPRPDRVRIDEFLLYRNLRGRFETLDSLVASWQRLIHALEAHPQSLQYEEYDNWLTVRDSLEDALSLLPPASRRGLEARVRPLDEGFVEATHAVPSTIKPTSPWRAQRWWWYRVPHPIHNDFQNRLESHAASAPEAAAGVVGRDTPAGRRYACPCCDFLTLSEPPTGTFAICPVCRWEDDNLQFEDLDKEGGANAVSLRQARQNFRLHGVSDPRRRERARPLRPEETPSLGQDSA
jgi:hypothetical protein